MKKTVLILLFCGIFTGIFAQENEQPNNKGFMAFLHGGYGLLPNRIGGFGLTDPSAEYAKKLASGGSWNAQAYFRSKMFIVGLMYSGYASKESYFASFETSPSQLKSSDNILTTYIAPQVGMNIPVSKSFDINWNAGFGGIWLKNNGKVYEKPRIVKGSTVGVNLGVRGIYNFTEHFGLSAEIMGIAASIGATNVDYHNQNLRIEYFPLMHISQFTFSLGLKYSL
ncbi:MAG: outer membrane beta-barrel protein [Prevotellaceae bacterium]|jgi:hypothetical protein|nr:outer membrane beta-barrel protein [Prevotellaceae bacterium]